MRGIFRNLQTFNQAQIALVPNESGIYIVWRLASPKPKPFYTGRSRMSMRDRLLRHLRGAGSRKIAAGSKASLLFEYQNMTSVEQAEAVLIRELGTREYANLGSETDPAERF